MSTWELSSCSKRSVRKKRYVTGRVTFHSAPQSFPAPPTNSPTLHPTLTRTDLLLKTSSELRCTVRCTCSPLKRIWRAGTALTLSPLSMQESLIPLLRAWRLKTSTCRHTWPREKASVSTPSRLARLWALTWATRKRTMRLDSPMAPLIPSITNLRRTLTPIDSRRVRSRLDKCLWQRVTRWMDTLLNSAATRPQTTPGLRVSTCTAPLAKIKRFVLTW